MGRFFDLLECDSLLSKINLSTAIELACKIKERGNAEMCSLKSVRAENNSRSLRSGVYEMIFFH